MGPMNSLVMEDFHDPAYNVPRAFASKVLPMTPTSPEMHQWEQRGYQYGYCAGGHCSFKQDFDRMLEESSSVPLQPMGAPGSGF